MPQTHRTGAGARAVGTAPQAKVGKTSSGEGRECRRKMGVRDFRRRNSKSGNHLDGGTRLDQ